MKRLLQRDIISSLFLASCFWLLVYQNALAIIDINDNTMSDLWEEDYHNQTLFPGTADYLPTADPDSDGWTNAQEAAAGTDPFEANPPDGIVRPELSPETAPGAYTLVWPSLHGKAYQLQCSETLASGTWIDIGAPLLGDGEPIIKILDSQPSNGTLPPKLFWRVTISDADQDGDGLTDAEEHALGSNPNDPYGDFDSDGMPDSWEILHGLNPRDAADALLDPDADGLTNAQEYAQGRNPKDHDVITSLECDWEIVDSVVHQTTYSDGSEIWEGHWSDGTPAYLQMAHETFQHVLEQRNLESFDGPWRSSIERDGGIDGGIFWLHPDGMQPSNQSDEHTYSWDGVTFKDTWQHASKYLVRIARNTDTGPEVRQHYIALIYQQLGMTGVPDTFPVDLIIPKNQRYSQTIEVKSDSPHALIGLVHVEVSVPREVAPNRSPDENADPPNVKYKPATEVNVATWEDSFEHDDPEDLSHWWVKNDMDHIRVKIHRPDKRGQGSLKITVRTENLPDLTEYNDPENEVELEESDAEPGLFEYFFLLVSNDVDDAFSGPDEGLKDKTHRIAVGGELILKYENNEVGRLKVPEKGRIRLRPLVLWYPGPSTGEPAATTAEVKDDVDDIRRRLAQAGIAVDWDENAWGIDVMAVSGTTDRFKENGMTTGLPGSFPSSPRVSLDEDALSKYIARTYPSPVIGAKDILMVYSKQLHHLSWLGNVTSNDPVAYAIIPSLSATVGVSAMIVTSNSRNIHTMSHEVLHMLLDDVHPLATTGKHNEDFKLKRRLWSGGPNDGKVTDRVRLSKKNANQMVPDLQKSSYAKP